MQNDRDRLIYTDICFAVHVAQDLVTSAVYDCLVASHIFFLLVAGASSKITTKCWTLTSKPLVGSR